MARPGDDDACRRVLQATDLYEALGVPREADEATIKAEYRQRAREIHPDKNKSSLASEAFKKVSKAHEILSDASRRQDYDTYGEEGQRPRINFHHFRHQTHFNPGFGRQHHYEPQRITLLGALLPLLLAAMLASTLFMMTGNAARSRGADWASQAQGSWGRHDTRNQEDKYAWLTSLTKDNADAACLRPQQKSLCVVLLTQKGLEEKHKRLLEELRSDASTIRTSTGQSLNWKWATAPAVGMWPTLLPEEVTLPWVVVFKYAKAQLRAIAMPVPLKGGKQKRRLSEGVPKLLRSIADGTARFDKVDLDTRKLFTR
mmetsp:Transcript_92249/g.246657  ORF Transcript_92249/g.246657 Transcript_92249/m.246657 type:complete len:315 (+) Transcript_92249:28-972(+)